MHIKWRGLELPSSVQVDQHTLSRTYGKFVAEPFTGGFGTTVGNSLRRVLLSSLEGSAVTQIKIRGAQHEFTTLPGVLEDVTEIVLNIKSLVVKNHSESTKVITVERSTAGVITGADVETDSDVEVINRARAGNPDQRRRIRHGDGRGKRSRLCAVFGAQCARP